MAGLKEWFKQDWVDIGSKKKGGGFNKCGRKSASGSKRKYPKCVPAAKAARMTESQRRSAVARKRAKPQGVGGKPTNVRTFAKRKFKVYPSAYANAYASKICAGKIKDPSGVKRKDFKGPKPAGKAMGGRIYKAGGGVSEAAEKLRRQGLKGGGICKKGMNRKAIGKNS